MKGSIRSNIVGFCFWSALTANAAPFANLDFESGDTTAITLQPYPDYGIPKYFWGQGQTKDLLPGWSLSLGGFPLNEIGYNAGKASLFERAVVEGRFPWLVGVPPADNGRYVLFFDHGDGFPSYEIVQRGDVPADARLIQINGLHLSPSGYFTASMDGVAIIGGDITVFAGKNVELKITSEWVLPPFPQVPAGTPIAFIDSISFFRVADMSLTITSAPPSIGDPRQVTIRFNPEPGHNYFVEYHEGLERFPRAPSLWQVLPGAPHNSGSVTDSTMSPQRLYRVRSVINAP